MKLILLALVPLLGSTLGKSIQNPIYPQLKPPFPAALTTVSPPESITGHFTIRLTDVIHQQFFGVSDVLLKLEAQLVELDQKPTNELKTLVMQELTALIKYFSASKIWFQEALAVPNLSQHELDTYKEVIRVANDFIDVHLVPLEEKVKNIRV